MASTAAIRIGGPSAGITEGFFHQPFVPLANHFTVKGNTLIGNPEYGISLTDSREPENFGPSTKNLSYGNVITENDFTRLEADRDIGFGRWTRDNLVFGNKGMKTVFRAFGDEDHNWISLTPDSAARYVEEEIRSEALEDNLLGDPSVRPMLVWLPPGYDSSPDKRYPVIYYLHGFTGDHTSPRSNPIVGINIHEVAEELIAEKRMASAILVLVHAANRYGGSFYARNPVIGDYRTYVSEEIVQHVDANFRTMADRSHRYLLGNSMGGNGALSLAMEYPETFGAVAALGPSAEMEASPTPLEAFIESHPEGFGEPALVQGTEELFGLLSGDVLVNLLYARAAAFSPNPNKPPYFVDLPIRYPEKAIVESVWEKWEENDLVSELHRRGASLKDTRVLIDFGVGLTTIMPESHDIAHLRRALDDLEIDHTFSESPGDHLSHLHERMETALPFLAPLP